MQGQLDTELNVRGRAQADAVATVLAERKPALIVSSDLRRAAVTAQALAHRVGTGVRSDARLRETHLGQWQGLTHSEVEQRWPGGLHRWRTDPQWAPPGGETKVTVAERGVAVVRELDWDVEAERPVALVAHGGLIIAVTAQLLELPVSRWWVLGGLGNTRWAELRSTADGWRLHAWNAGVP
ncbi:MAG: histidine phosphatase family protein [Mycobacteriaceae bacterium]